MPTAAETGEADEAEATDEVLAVDVLADVHRVLHTERRRANDEAEALEAFRNRIGRIGAATPSVDRTPASPGSLVERRPGGGLAAVREAYETTVMRVPHYELEYDDSYAESLTAEFGPEIAGALTEGTAFEPSYKRLLLTAAADAIDDRHRFLERVAAERSAVETVETRLHQVVTELSEYGTDGLESRPFGTLDAYRRRLSVLEDRCDDIAAERQRRIRNERLDRSAPIDDLQSYLYQDFERTYPVLGAVVDVADSIRETRRAVSRAIGHCR
jgi:hypothetical protein